MNSSKPISLVIADDHQMTLDGLDLLLNEPEFSVLASVCDGKKAIQAVQQLHPDVLLLDVSMAETDGFGVLQELYRQGIVCKTLLYTYQMEDQRLLEAMTWGVRGVVLKSMSPAMLLMAIRKVYMGGQWLEMETISRMLERDVNQHRVAALLSARELELVRVAAKGYRNQAIAAQLHIQEGTVRIHLHNIYQKLGLDGRGALIAFAQKNGLI